MKLTNWFLNFDFATRARRSHMWANWLSWFGVWIAILILAAMMGSGSSAEPSGAAAGTVGILMIVAGIAAFVDGVAMTFRRAHDTGKSGWIWLLLLVPVVNLLPLYWLLIEDSQQGPNKYGPPVKQFYEPAKAEVG
jgi:uncharacterized membrane protein YhaH (DUF805 family)